MEKFHWLDQNPKLPNFIFATLRFAIRIDPEIARQALAIALRRQPMAALEPKLIGGRWCWKPIQNLQLDGPGFFSSRLADKIGNEDSSTGSQHQCEFDKYVSYFLSVINLSESAMPSEVLSEIRFLSNHAANDGVAGAGLVNDWLIVYNNLVASEPAENGLVSLDSSSFQKRGVLGLLSWNYLKGLPQQAIALFGAAKFIFRKTKTIAAETLLTKNPVAHPAIKGAWIDVATLKADRGQATQQQVGYTAWCLAKCFIAINRWNQKREAEFGKEPLGDQGKSNSVWRILLPISTRTAADRAAVAANRTAIVQIDRRPPETAADQVAFCQSIDHEINFIRRWQLEKMFLLAIRVASLSNSLLAKTANNPVSRGAAVFTHLGRPFKRAMIYLNRLSPSESNTQLARPIDFDLTGPIRIGTPINISFARFKQRLKISLHYDPQVISIAEADRLLATIVDLFLAEAG